MTTEIKDLIKNDFHSEANEFVTSIICKIYENEWGVGKDQLAKSLLKLPSPYYLSEAEYQWIKANPAQLEQKLGLPLSSVNAEYDVFTITSQANNNKLFQSTVAPTKQFANSTPSVIYNTTGGRTQSLIINNGDTDFWIKSSSPIETISPNNLPQIGN